MEKRRLPSLSVFKNLKDEISIQVDDDVISIPLEIVPQLQKWIFEVFREMETGR